MTCIQHRLIELLGYTRSLGLAQTARLYSDRIRRNSSELLLSVEGISTPVSCRPATSDFQMFRHVFIDRDGDPPLAISPRLIIDGGANVGYASVLYANKYPQAKIIAVEPDSGNCGRLRQNCATLPNVQLIQGGIWGRNTHLRIRFPEADPAGFEVIETDDVGPDTLEGFTIGKLLDQSHEDIIDLVKLDIERSEIQVFSAADLDWVDRTRVICIEVHGTDAEEVVLRAFESRDFSRDQKGEKLTFTNNRLVNTAATRLSVNAEAKILN